MAILDVFQMVTQLQNFIKAKNPQVDIQPGTDLYDLLFLTNAQAARSLFEAINTLQLNQSLSTTTGTDLDLIAKNYNITRRPATYATGEVTFYATSFSTDILIPSGTIVSTAGTNVTPPIRFLTTKSVGMDVVNKAIYYDSTATRYQVTTPIIAESAGISSNVDTQIINQIVSPVANISGVVNNTPTIDGTAQETDAQLQQRCLQAFVVGSVGTLYGYRKLLTDNYTQVLDVKSIGPFDTGAIRTDGVDTFVILSSTSSAGNSIQTSETFVFNTGDTGYVPVNRPVITIDTVYGTATGAVRTFIPYPNAFPDYKYVKDTTGAYAMSVQSADKLLWLSGIKPDTNSSVLITYTYNSLVQTMQTFMNRDENKVVGANALVKLGFIAQTYITLSVKYFSTVTDTGAAQTKVAAAITQYLSSFTFGQQLDLSDLIVVVQTGAFTDYTITEVDYVVFNTAQMYAIVPDLGYTLPMVNDVIIVSANQYIREGLTVFV